MKYQVLLKLYQDTAKNLIGQIKLCNHLLKQNNFLIDILLRIKQRYPHIYGECITREEVIKATGRYSK